MERQEESQFVISRVSGLLLGDISQTSFLPLQSSNISYPPTTTPSLPFRPPPYSTFLQNYDMTLLSSAARPFQTRKTSTPYVASKWKYLCYTPPKHGAPSLSVTEAPLPGPPLSFPVYPYYHEPFGSNGKLFFFTSLFFTSSLLPFPFTFGQSAFSLLPRQQSSTET